MSNTYIPKLNKFAKTKRVTIGPYRVNQKDVKLIPPKITLNNTQIMNGSLYDPRMGIIDRLTNQACRDDFAKCFGTNGIITLNQPIVHPAFAEELMRFLHLFIYENNELVLLDSVGAIQHKNVHKKEYRRFQAIVREVSNSAKWSVEDDGRILYKKGNDIRIYLTPYELKELLIKLSSKMAKDINDDSIDTNMTYKMLGINSDISRPEYFIINYIPVMPNPLRAPTYFPESVGLSESQYTKKYGDLVAEANTTGAKYATNVTEAYNSIIVGSGQDTVASKFNLKNKIFSSGKENFIRGNMFSKVGGQIIRSVVTPNPRMKPHQIGIPRRLARDISQRVPVTNENINECRRLISEGVVDYILDRATNEYIKLSKQQKIDLEPGKSVILRELREGDVILANRQPSLHRNSLLGFEVLLHDDETVKIHPSATKGFGMDFN